MSDSKIQEEKYKEMRAEIQTPNNKSGELELDNIAIAILTQNKDLSWIKSFINLILHEFDKASSAIKTTSYLKAFLKNF